MNPDKRFTLETKPITLDTPDRGICYLGRIPTGMNSTDIRRALMSFSVDRIHLNIRKKFSNAISKQKNKRGGKRRQKQFKDGYIEFNSKAEAIRASRILNGNIIGLGKKSSRAFHEIWCLKYKPKLTWDILVDKAVGKKKLKEIKIKHEFAKLEKKHDFIAGKRFKSQKMMAELRRKAKRELKQEGKWVTPNADTILEGKSNPKTVYENNKKLINEKILTKMTTRNESK